MTDDIRTYKPLLFVVFVGLVFRLMMISSYGIWHDERVSILIAHGLHHSVPVVGEVSAAVVHSSNNLPSVVDATILDNGNGLLYNVVLHYWLNVFGSSDMAARMLSVLFGLLVIPLVYAFAQKLLNARNIAIAASLIAAVHPLLVAYAQQARPYAMATFFTLLSSIMLIDMLRGRATFRSYMWYAFASSCALLTHYLTAYILISHVLIFLLQVRSSKSYIHYILSGSLVVLVFFVWMINGGLDGMKVLDVQNARYAAQAANYVEGQKSFAMPATPKNVITGWVQVWLQVFGNRYQNFGLRIREIGILLVIPFALIAFFGWLIRKDQVLKSKLKMLLLLVFVQTGFATVLALRAGHCISFQALYASFTVPYAAVLLAWACIYLYESAGYQKISVALGSLLLVVMLSSCFTTYLNTNDIFPVENGHWNKARQLAGSPAGNRVAVKSSMDLQLIAIYLPEDADIVMTVDSTVVDDSYSVERNP